MKEVTVMVSTIPLDYEGYLLNSFACASMMAYRTNDPRLGSEYLAKAAYEDAQAMMAERARLDKATLVDSVPWVDGGNGPGFIGPETPIGTILEFENVRVIVVPTYLPRGEVKVVGVGYDTSGIATVWLEEAGKDFSSDGKGLHLSYWNTEYAPFCTGRRDPK